MSENLTSKVCAVYDQGLFVSLAELLAPHFAKVYYCTSTAGSFPTTSQYVVGTGIEGVERLNDITDAEAIEDKIDLHIFADLYLAGRQQRLRRAGARVWGAGHAEMLELDRLKFKQLAEKLDLSVGRYEVVKGITALRAFLKTHEGWPVKTARFGPPGRGDFETIRPGYTYRQLEFRIDEIEQRLGAEAEKTEFIVEEPIKDAVELAIDSYCVEGEYPSKALLGLEVKGDGYVGKVVDYDDCPDSLLEVNEALSPTFKRAHYAQMAAIECRLVKGGQAFVLDPCLRFPRPPLSLQLVISNWPQIFWSGGAGEITEPQFLSMWCAESCIYSDYAEEHPTRIDFPSDLASKHLKLSNYCISGGARIVVPQHYGLSGLGSVVATGSTMKKAIENVRELSKELKGYDVKCSDKFDDAEESLAKMKDYGVDAFDE